MEHWHRSGQALLNEISSTRLPASQLAVWSIGQCGFIFKYEDTVVCIDPVLSDLTDPSGSRRCYPAPFAPEALRADLVLCTHGHADHMAKDTLRGLARHPAARFVLPAGCSALAAEYGIPADRITTVQEGSILPLGGVTVRAFSAAHPEHILDAGDPGMALGYQLTFGGFTVVHLGDTYLTPHLYETLQTLPRPDLLLVDGNRFRSRDEIPYRCIVKGDATYACIAAASILAKTERDRLMKQLAEQYPQYGWEKNKGYPSPAHRAAIAAWGPSPLHRRTFRLLDDQTRLAFPEK